MYPPPSHPKKGVSQSQKKKEDVALGVGNRGSHRGEKKKEFLGFKWSKVHEDWCVRDLESHQLTGQED